MKCFSCNKGYYMKQSRLDDIKAKGHNVVCNDCYQPSVSVECVSCSKSYHMKQDRLNAILAKGHKVTCNDCIPVPVHCSVKDCTTSFHMKQARLDSIKAKGHDVVCNDCMHPSVGCNNCHKFFLSKQQIAWYEHKGFHSPKFCKPCRELHEQEVIWQKHEAGRTRNGKRS